MVEAADLNEWKHTLWPTVEMKAEEFELIGYEQIDREEIWNCVPEKMNRKKVEQPFRLHQLVNEVLSLSLNDYMNRQRMAALRGPDWFGQDAPLQLNEFDEPST